MRKFKLKKNYPDSMLELGDELIFNNDQKIITREIGNFDYDYSLENCINYPEFWEEVIEKDYEILSFIANQNLNTICKGDIITKQFNNTFTGISKDNVHYDSLLEERLLKLSHWSIHSVKRLSDGEVFTIGDTVKHNTGVIIKIESIDYKQLLGHDISFNILNARFDNIKEKIKVLFKTEDGVEIFEGDTYYKVVNKSFQLLIMEKASKGESLKSKIFSTKEKAEEYIIMNKPCLTINDVRNCINQTEIDIDNEHELNYQLLQSVKEKLYGNK